ncbi:MAG: DEAD/DEAH box helicase family protein, partial [Methylophagaceae bacterium]
KSLIIYLITQYYKKKTLLIVPTVSLVQQMAGDFKDYGYKDECHLISAGVDKESTEDIVISTWQSLYKMPKKWFQQFDVVIGDEAHLFKAKSLTSIMTKLDQCAYRFGFTGTLDDAQTHKLVLEGLFGGIEKVTTTAALIEDGTLAEFKVRCIVLQYPDIVKQAHAKDKYPDEVDFLVRNEARNKFIRNLALSLKGNTLLLFNFVEKHGKPLHQSIKHSIDKSVDKRPLYYVSGEVSGSDREDIRHIVEQQDNAIIVASFGTFSTGINIKQLNNIIFASPSKSRIRVMQSIGRGLRKSETKTEATLFDIADNLTWKSKSNFTINHFAERLKMYNDEKFEYKMYKVKIK